MKRILALILCLAMLTGIAGAGSEPTEEYAKKLERCVDYYNKHAEKVPEFLSEIIIGNQKINVQVLNGDETVLVCGMRTKGVAVKEFNDEHFKKPDMDVYIQQSLINQVLKKDNRSATKERIKDALAAEDSGRAVFYEEYRKACDSGEFKCVPRKPGAKIRMFVVELLV